MENAIVNAEQQPNTAVTAMPTNADFMLGLQELKRRADMVSQIKQQIMRPDVHFGLIPGCGKKPTLLKNGAELLCMAFKLASDAKVQITDLGNGHREYTVTTTLASIGTGELIATGLGSCSTMESKYRYRGNEMENTGKPVPREYWNSKDPATLGGRGFTAKKDENGQWMIFRKGSNKMENPDIADTYNTVLKMASKRSLVDAVLKATGGSCEFTQDIEDNQQEYGASMDYEPAEYAEQAPQQAAPAPRKPAPAPKAAAPKRPLTPAEKTANFCKVMNAERAKAPATFDSLLGTAGYERAEDVEPENRTRVLQDIREAMSALDSAKDSENANEKENA